MDRLVEPRHSLVLAQRRDRRSTLRRRDLLTAQGRAVAPSRRGRDADGARMARAPRRHEGRGKPRTPAESVALMLTYTNPETKKRETHFGGELAGVDFEDGGHRHRCLKSGLRFSTNARMPSF